MLFLFVYSSMLGSDLVYWTFEKIDGCFCSGYILAHSFVLLTAWFLFKIPNFFIYCWYVHKSILKKCEILLNNLKNCWKKKKVGKKTHFWLILGTFHFSAAWVSQNLNIYDIPSKGRYVFLTFWQFQGIFTPWRWRHRKNLRK